MCLSLSYKPFRTDNFFAYHVKIFLLKLIFSTRIENIFSECHVGIFWLKPSHLLPYEVATISWLSKLLSVCRALLQKRDRLSKFLCLFCKRALHTNKDLLWNRLKNLGRLRIVASLISAANTYFVYTCLHVL